jgi:putative membrane protein
MLMGAAVALVAAPFGARAEDKAPFEDAAFVKMAAIGGMYEVYLGDLVAKKTTNDDVKKFAERVVKDHTAANAELLVAAKAGGFEVPAKIDDKHQQKYEAFKAYKGDAFDRDYVKDMVKDHEEDVALFTRASKDAKNPAIKEFATKTLPTLQKHLEMVKKLDK